MQLSTPESDSRSDQPSSAWLLGLMALTIFVSAFLLFQVQPLISKLILPWFGGSPTVWTTAMLFFQCVLFGGYLYAHLVTRYVSLRMHLISHIALLVFAALMSFMIMPSDFLKPKGDENPAIRILLLLFVCVGVPYFTLASTGPIVQAWFARLYPGKSPYRLYSLSNLGSFLALLSFPYLFEPLLNLPQMGMAWTALFWFFALSCAVAAVWLMKKLPSGNGENQIDPNLLQVARAAPSSLHMLLWIALPALASLTMIAVTDHVSHNVAPEPRLWITTLALYLLTFIITFDHERWYRRGIVATITLIAIVFLTGRTGIFETLGIDWSFGASELRWSHFVAMFLICFQCHGELVRIRPKNPAFLTDFYLRMSAGGACGGFFASIIAVNFFKDYYEWPLCLILATILSVLIIVSVVRGLVTISRQTEKMQRPVALVTCCLLVSWVGFWTDPFEWLEADGDEYKTEKLYQGRNFYGAISVEDQTHLTEPDRSYRGFYNGNVTHGFQLTSEGNQQLPVTYYGPNSGAGETIEYAKARQPSLRIAVVGLGAGSLAAYCRKEDHIDFYEINPEVIRVAETFFTFIKDCKATTNLILGDGRLKIEDSNSPPYDIILLDAFTGGSVPVHLLTQEAFEMYHRHLKPDGFIVAHITNSYLNLYPVVKLQAESLKMGYRSKYELFDRKTFVRRNQYMTITNDKKFLEQYPSVYPPVMNDKDEIIDRKEPNREGVRLWTDHYSSINQIEIRD